MQVLIIGTVWPEPTSSAAGSRLLQLIHLFQQQNWQFTFASSAQKSEHSFDLGSIGVGEKAIELNQASFNGFVAGLNPQMVMFDRFMTEEQYGWRVKEECPNAILVLDTEDLHFLRLARQAAVLNGQKVELSDLKTEAAIREIASIYRCDLSIIISSFEMDLLRQEFCIDPALIHHLPFMVDQLSEALISALPSFEDRNHFITIGNFLHPPNWDSVQFLKSEVWPVIRKELPEAEMHVYGAYASSKHLQLNDHQNGFLVKGRAKDAKHEMLEHRVMLAPLRFGAGLKGKLLEAMEGGTPSVSTSIGAEGMHDDLPWGGSIRDDPMEFAKAAVQLYRNKDEWLKAQNNGFRIVNEVFAKKDQRSQFIKRVSDLATDLDNHRSLNFIGQMLHHHTMRSTEFMSRWIEEKNLRGTS